MDRAFFTEVMQRLLVLPPAAVQAIGDRHVVYIPVKGEEGKFVQRLVRLGAPVGDAYAVLSGLKPGETVVTEGSFLLRLESLNARSVRR